MKKIELCPRSPLSPTEIYFGRHLLISPLLKDFCSRWRVVIVIDQSLKEIYGTPLAAFLKGELIAIPGGEKAKTKEMQDILIDELFKRGCDRQTVLLAVGGGTITDLVGFVASIYLRGIPLVLIPTTLLAMVDAAIGGKTAIDTPLGKNLIGTIYPPQAVFSDTETLLTLPEKEWINGLAEILKIGLVQDREIWKGELNHEKDPELIFRAMQGKVKIVEQDPTEQSIRRILNFGHTIGHALETAAHYELAHGEAVAIGCTVEAHLSMELGYLSQKAFEEVVQRYRSFPLHLPKSYTREKSLEALSRDKKKAAGQIRFVLIDKIGHAISFEGAYCRAVSLKELEASLDWMEQTYHG